MKNLIIAGASLLLVSSLAFATPDSTHQNDVLGSLPQNAAVANNNSAHVSPSVNAKGNSAAKKGIHKRHHGKHRKHHRHHAKHAANPNLQAK